ncbi:winged helix-turn-helix domain-containing protein [Piscinibacter sp. XHJ-5]|uniref:ATP-binding protein n=1 Tax=Piscinibacter sp. XHJ-5 TaxID=3037797 RepID=UPI00245297C3|nr:winged helix-turn-helix domain-containing protein [Piscinibacter sp. XHJ-5]
MPLRFGPGGRFELQPAERRLLVDGKPAVLGARALDLLIALAAQPDHLLTKNELLDRVWPGLVVEEANLQVQIANLRKLLGADVIATVPGRGYRFAARVDGAAAALPEPCSPTNLGVEHEPLYGRDDDLALVCELARAHRLVTVVGAGGIGKTRLAQAAARRLSDDHLEGVWLVELAALADPTLLPSAVAQALGLGLRGQRAPLEELVAQLQARRLLLLLDNCEHLLEGVSLLAQALLTRTPQVHLLVTSQEPLHVPGEQQYRLGPLGVPAEGEPLDAAGALAFGGVRLFVERVRALDPRFMLESQQAAAVADICRQLDGLALAIELAAARVPALGVQGVRERLEARLRMLTAGSRFALRRHQTLRAALDWSHQLLDDDERAVFRRLGLFSGGCTFEAVQRVAADERLDEWAVLDCLSALVDKSLVVADGADPPRYRLLESARAFALEKLAAAGETESLTRRHAEYYAAHFRRTADALFAGTASEDALLATRGAELDNLRAALSWALGDAGDAATAVALLAHTAPHYYLLPSVYECERWRQALARRARGASLSPKEHALQDYAQLMWSLRSMRLARVGDSMPPLAVPAALRPLDDPARQAYAAVVAAMPASFRGDVTAVRAALAEYDTLDPARIPTWIAAMRLHVVIRADHLADEVPDRRAEVQALLDRVCAGGDPDGRTAFVLRMHLALDSLLRERHHEAAERFAALAEQGRRQRRDAFRMCWVLGPCVMALAEIGSLDAARQKALELLPLLQHTGTRSDYAPAIALVAVCRGNAAAAARMIGAGDADLARNGGKRMLPERRACAHAMALLEATATRAQIDAWLAEGALLGDQEFERLVQQL